MSHKYAIIHNPERRDLYTSRIMQHEHYTILIKRFFGWRELGSSDIEGCFDKYKFNTIGDAERFIDSIYSDEAKPRVVKEITKES